MVASTSTEMLSLGVAQGAIQRFREFEKTHPSIDLSTATGRNVPADDPILSIAADALKSGRLKSEELRLSFKFTFVPRFDGPLPSRRLRST